MGKSYKGTFEKLMEDPEYKKEWDAAEEERKQMEREIRQLMETAEKE